MIRKILGISTASLFLLVGCGGGSSSGDNSDNNNILTGIFVDSAVEGASYTTATQSGTTNSAGEFNYVEGEQVIFSIGDTVLPSVAAAPQVSPVDIASGSSNPEDTATNIARLLQSLDTDGNPDNGISISAEAAAGAASINFDVSTDQFANDPAVINLVSNSGSVNGALISAEDANAHLNDTLGTSNSTGSEPTITSHSLSDNNSQLTVVFSVDMQREAKTEGEYIPSRTYWLDARTFIVEFESVQVGGSIRLIPEFFISASGEMLTESLEVTFPNTAAGGENTQETGSTDIVLDLRGTTWLGSSEAGCDGGINTISLTYSQTGLSANINRAEDRGDGCKREENVFPERSFSEIETGIDYPVLLVCGGDGLCTFDELNRTINLPANDPRNTCTDHNESIAVTQSVAYEVGSNRIVAIFCDPNQPVNYLKQ